MINDDISVAIFVVVCPPIMPSCRRSRLAEPDIAMCTARPELPCCRLLPAYRVSNLRSRVAVLTAAAWAYYTLWLDGIRCSELVHVWCRENICSFKLRASSHTLITALTCCCLTATTLRPYISSIVLRSPRVWKTYRNAPLFVGSDKIQDSHFVNLAVTVMPL